MADGDVASAAGYTVALPASSHQANTIANLIAKVQDDLAAKVGTKGAAIPLSLGGTGATSASAARTALGLGTVATENTLPVAKGGTGATTASGARTALGAFSSSGGTLPGDFGVVGEAYFPNATAAVSSYVVAYLDGSGRLCRGASSERFKKNISSIDPLKLGQLFPPLKKWKMRGGDDVWRYGYTAEQLAADPVTEPFVQYEREIERDKAGNPTAEHLKRDAFGNPIPLSIDFIGLLLAQNAQLAARVSVLEARLGG